ncbi:MAG TPA: VIT and VWA domain-containing protein, partial [Dehalococcoidia bacterium]|nr:VIT and VWA domain-containing protein [Dehalococcoidia bacterium]
MFNRSFVENRAPAGVAVLEALDGSGFVPLRRTEVRGRVTGPLAAMRVTHVYGYSRTACDRTLEAVYRFPLPGDAAVTAVRVRFGTVEIVAALREREEAQAAYDTARNEGRQAALLTRESPDVFSLHLAGLHPEEDVTVETSYVQLARPEGDGWTLRVPLTVATRYSRGDEREHRSAQAQPLAVARDPGHRFRLAVTVAAAEVASPTHGLKVTREGETAHVTLAGGDAVPDCDLVLTWRPAQPQDRPALQVWHYRDAADGHTYFLALAAPPAGLRPGSGAPREAVLLIDHSGSMEGPKWEAADWTVRSFLGGLRERDTFNLGLFHTATRWFADQPRAADDRTIASAIRFLESHRDSGGTELGVALEQALHLPRTPGQRGRHVLVVTDGQVTDSGRLVRLVDDEAARPDARRVSILCIDAAPNDFLVTDLATRGGGVARFLTSAPDASDITSALDDLLRDWAEPVLTSLRLEFDRPGVESAAGMAHNERQHGWIDLGDLPAGRPIWTAGRVPDGSGGVLRCALHASGQHNVATAVVDSTVTDDASGMGEGLKALFGARRVAELEYLMTSGHDATELHARLARLGYDPAVVLDRPARVYADNASRDARQALRALLV